MPPRKRTRSSTALARSGATYGGGSVLTAAILHPDAFKDVRFPVGDLYPTATVHSVHSLKIKACEDSTLGKLTGAAAIFLNASWNCQYFIVDNDHNTGLANIEGFTPSGAIRPPHGNNAADKDFQPDPNMVYYQDQFGAPDPLNSPNPLRFLRCCGVSMHIQDLTTSADDLGGEVIMVQSFVDEWSNQIQPYEGNTMDPRTYINRPIFLRQRNGGQSFSAACIPVDDIATKLRADTWPVKNSRFPDGQNDGKYRWDQKVYMYQYYPYASPQPESFDFTDQACQYPTGWSKAVWCIYGARPGAEFTVNIYANYEGYPKASQWSLEDVAKAKTSPDDLKHTRMTIEHAPQHSINTNVSPLDSPKNMDQYVPAKSSSNHGSLIRGILSGAGSLLTQVALGGIAFPQRPTQCHYFHP